MTVEENLHARIVARAAGDEQFRRQLVGDPKTTIAETFGVTLPGTTITVLEETPDQLYLVLPTRLVDGELSERELSGVVGGVLPPDYTMLVMTCPQTAHCQDV